MSKHMIPIANAADIQEMISQSLTESNSKNIYKRRYDIIISYAPDGNVKNGGDWHKNFLNSANWLDTDRLFLQETSGRTIYGRPSWFSTTLWTDANLASRGYFDRFWRNPSCKVSCSDLGLVIKTHVRSEVEGLLYLMPQAKIFSLDNYDNWKAFCSKSKVMPNKLSVWQSAEPYQVIDNSFVFNMDDLMWSDDAFLQQMQSAFEYFELDDFESVKDHLPALKAEYIRWNEEFGSCYYNGDNVERI